MSGHPSLFGPTPDPDARASDPQTSHEAAVEHVGKQTHRKAVLVKLCRAHAGMTDDELQRALPEMHPGSVSKRRLDLHRHGLVTDTGLRRETRTGYRAIVWEATARGRSVDAATDPF